MNKLKKTIIIIMAVVMIVGVNISYATNDFAYRGTAKPSVSVKSSSTSAFDSDVPMWIFVLTGIAFLACVFMFIKVVMGRKKRQEEKGESESAIREEEK